MITAEPTAFDIPDLEALAQRMLQMAATATLTPSAPPGPAPPGGTSGASQAALLPVPGAETVQAESAALSSGQDPSLMSLDLVPLRPGGRDAPLFLRPPHEAGAPSFYFLDASPASAPAHAPALDALAGVQKDFPILQQEVNGHRLVWLDNAATTQKPQQVIDTLVHYYSHDNSNVHRGAHTLAQRATALYEDAREKARRFLGASSTEEIVFVRGATEGINLVAQSFGRGGLVRAGDEVVVTQLEHHSNIVPWQMLCEQTGAVLRVVPADDRGEVRMDVYERLLGPRTRIVALCHVSNVLGTLLPVAPMAALAHRHGARVLVDGAQAAAHLPVDVKCLGADFYVLSGHKTYGPTGIGVLWGRKAILEELPPWQGGGNMIDSVTFEGTTYANLPAKFEAGTGNIAGAIGLGAALDYIDRLGRPQVASHEEALMDQLLKGLHALPGVHLLGAPAVRIGAVSFIVDRHEPSEVARYLNQQGIAVRAGHHCAQPILRRFGLNEAVRPSLGIYNTADDIEAFLEAMRRLPRSHPPSSL